MSHAEDRTLEALALEAAGSGMNRLTFIKRALALGCSVPAIAGALAALDGPSPAYAAASAPKQIAFSSWGSLDEQVTVDKVLKVFMTRQPNIQVQPRFTDFGDYFVKLNADLAAKSISDVLFMTFVPTYASRGALLDIRALAKRHGKNLSAYTTDQLFAFESNGGLFGVPRDNDTKVIYYNRKLFKQAGVAFPKDGWSWDDLRTTAKALTKGSAPRISQYGFAYESNFWRLWLWQAGVELFDSDSRPTKATFNTPAAAQALQFLADLTNKDQVTPPATQLSNPPTLASLFAGGQLAMLFGNHALVPTFAKTPGLDWFVAGMPHFAGQPAVNVAGGAGYCISKFTKEPEAAYQLWDFLTGPVGTLMFSEGNDVTPIDPGTLRSAFWRSKPYNRVFEQQSKIGHRLPWFPTFFNILNVIDSALQKVWIGEQSAADALPIAEKAANKALASGS